VQQEKLWSLQGNSTASEFEFTKVESSLATFEPYREKPAERTENDKPSHKAHRPPSFPRTPRTKTSGGEGMTFVASSKSPLEVDEPVRKPAFDDDDDTPKVRTQPALQHRDQEKGDLSEQAEGTRNREDGMEEGEPMQRPSRRLSAVAVGIKKAERKLREAAKQDPAAVMQQWEELKVTFEGKLRVDTINVMLHICEEGKMKEAAEQVLVYAKEQHIEPNAATYSFTIRLAQDPEKAEALLQEATEKGLASLRTFSPLLVKFAKSFNVEKTFSLFQNLEQQKVVPDDVVFHALFRCLQQSPDSGPQLHASLAILRKYNHPISDELAAEITRLCTRPENGWDVQETSIHEGFASSIPSQFFFLKQNK